MSREFYQAGQRYVWIGDRLYARADGTVTTLDEWSSRCAECGVYYVVTSPRGLEPKVARRCREHSQPGRRIGRPVFECRKN